MFKITGFHSQRLWSQVARPKSHAPDLGFQVLGPRFQVSGFLRSLVLNSRSFVAVLRPQISRSLITDPKVLGFEYWVSALTSHPSVRSQDPGLRYQVPDPIMDPTSQVQVNVTDSNTQVLGPNIKTNHPVRGSKILGLRYPSFRCQVPSSQIPNPLKS